MRNIFENELIWMFIAGAVLGCVAVHSCSRTDQEACRTAQVQARAAADIEIARIRAGIVTNPVPAAVTNQVEASR